MALRLFCLLLLTMLLAGCYRTDVSSVYGSRGSKHSIYTVRAGDTLYSIGRRFGVDYHLLARRNHLRYPYTIYVGQHLYLTSIAPRASYMPVSKGRRTVKSVKTGRVRKTPPAANSHKVVRLQWPVKGKITSHFGRRSSRVHDGIDISAREGTPVRAAGSGEVVYADHRLAGYGKLIIIRHGPDLFTAYAHNQRNLVRKGAHVRAGDVIARVGRSGRASGPHLHFEVRRGSTPVDPLAYLPRR
ncbi:MAG: M23 family metallopeptidase [Mariprofundaceae bacterium]|nr:M23 family metallopeptidase [Mariprofundaceae bacterium]